MAKALAIFTVGPGTRPIGDFLAILESAGVRRLVDVRTSQGSRRNPQFGRDALAASLLAASLEGRGIENVWRRELSAG